ncbi:hypothetical protein CsSME_00027387 [Camellia sinensis var. sinensis]
MSLLTSTNKYVKSSIKLTRTRIDVLRRRKEVTQRFLKSNLAQLLANGLDINAYGRDSIGRFARAHDFGIANFKEKCAL